MPIKRLNIPIRLNDLFKVIRFFNSREEELHVSYQDLKNQLQTDLTVTAGSSTLDGLTDVTITSVANGQVLVYDSATSQWINQTAGPATTLDGLTDVTIAAVANGQFLVYNSGTSQWQNLTVSIPTTINSLTDVNTPSPVNGNVLTWDSATSQWIALAPAYSSTFAGLSDVNVAGVADDNTIRYDAASSKWVPTNITPATSLNGLTDVTLSSPANGQILIYNSTTSKWENQNAPTGTGTVTNVATGTGLTGGPITTTGTISLNTKLAPADSIAGNAGKFLRVNSGATAVEYADALNGTGFVKASGTTITYDNSTYVPTSTSVSTTNSSLSGGGSLSSSLTLQLVNDSASPGNDKVYGTDSSGTKGWYNAATGGGITALTGDVAASGTGSVVATLASNLKTGSFGVTVDGVTGIVQVGTVGYVVMPYAGNITGFSITANVAGTVSFDITSASGAIPTVSIITSGYPTITGTNFTTSTAVGGWSTVFAAGDVFGFSVRASPAPATIKNATLTIRTTRT